MDDPAASRRASRIPVPPSRLPRPLTVRPSPSKDSLREPTNGLSVPRLRATPSREQLFSHRNVSGNSTKDRVASTGTSIHPLSKVQVRPKPSDDALFKKPLARPPSRQEEPPQSLTNQPDNTSIKDLQSEADCFPSDTAVEDATPLRRSRPSLAERTIETLAQLPPSPAPSKRHSSFYSADSPMRPSSQTANGSRPGSSYQADASKRPPSRTTSSRPGSSAGYKAQTVPIDFRASTNTFKPPQATFSSHTPVKRLGASGTLRTPRSTANLRSSLTNLPSPKSPSERSPSPTKHAQILSPIMSGSKTVTVRPLRSRPSVGGLFRKPSMPDMGRKVEIEKAPLARKKFSPTFSNTSSEGASATSRVSKDSSTSIESVRQQTVTPRKSSMALRDQIAKAKAAKKAQTVRQASAAFDPNRSEGTAIIAGGGFDFGLDNDDPFNQGATGDVSKGLLRKRIESARTDGRLNIAAMGLSEIPVEVMSMYNLESINGGSWAESVDLTRFVAADNELKTLNEDIFPDIDPHQYQDDDDSTGNQFGGLETLDLHGNLLSILPVGLRRLELLTTLNLTNNKLDNSAFEVISQISSLRDLKIGSNSLSGELSPEISKLKNLEILDIQRNALTSLPDGIVELVRLRILNLTGNMFTSLQFETFITLPLVELTIANNKLSGVLISIDDIQMPCLQILDVTGNSLTQLASANLSLPNLHQLTCSANRLTSLPDMGLWKSLITLAAEDNSISELPQGLVTLMKLKNVDFSGNNLRTIDDNVCFMESLDSFRISGNPLRERNFSSMSTTELKSALKARITPEEVITSPVEASDVEFYSVDSSPSRPNSSDWPVKAGGVLDRSGTKSFSLNPVISAQIAGSNSIRTLELHHNMFKEIPSSIAFFADTLTSLSLAHNELTSDTFLKDDLDLPALKELNLSSNTFNSLQPLIRHLQAPRLEKLDISFNRLITVPVLRQRFPCLTIILASNNTIRELSPETVRGLKIMDCSHNDLGSLNARIGLLGGPNGLERLDVSGNRFRVPKYTILEKGTEATLAWLRDRIPAGEMSVPDLD